VKKKPVPKWKAQRRWCLRCAKVFFPRVKKQEFCVDCGVLVIVGMADIGK